MSKKQIDIYRTGIYLRLSQGDEDIDGLEKKESNSISNQKLLLEGFIDAHDDCLLYTSPSPRDRTRSRMPSSA